MKKEINYTYLRKKMISQLIEQHDIKNKAVLQAMQHVPREAFVALEFLNEAYSDYSLPIGYGQRISQPYMVALMMEALHLKPHHKVLEIGTGCGYQSAVLAQITQRLYTIEIVPKLAERAKNTLTSLNYQNIYYKQGNGLVGWQDEAPFDRIIVTAAPTHLPQKLIKQLRIGGYMVIPIGLSSQILYCIFRKSETEIDQQAISQVAFVPMIWAP